MEINVKPVPKIKIKLKDKAYICTFNMVAMSYMQEAIGSLEKDENITELSPAHMCAFILYAGIKANDESFTIEEAKALSMQMGIGTYGEVIGLFNKAVADSVNEEDGKRIKKMIAQKFAQNLHN